MHNVNFIAVVKKVQKTETGKYLMIIVFILYDRNAIFPFSFKWNFKRK